MKLSAGVTVSADLGAVKIGSNASFALSHSQDDSTKVASQQASEVINKAVKRVVETVRTQTTTITVVEVEDTDVHNLTNPLQQNISGVYRWLDKYYLASIVNLGPRLMLEFQVPEPAAFHVYSLTAKPEPDNAVAKPVFLTLTNGVKLLSADQIDASNFSFLAGAYEAVVAPPPELLVSVGVALKNGDNTVLTKSTDRQEVLPISTVTDTTLQVPDGYEAIVALVDGECEVIVKDPNNSFWPPWPWESKPFKAVAKPPLIAALTVGADRLDMRGGPNGAVLDKLTGTVPVSIFASTSHWAFNVVAICLRTDERYGRWQQDTFTAIMAGYDKKVSDYRTWLASQAEDETDANTSNPDLNRMVEQTELKRAALEILTNQHFDAMNAMGTDPATHYPQIDIDRIRQEAPFVEFFEQAFDWTNMTYLFYPYFWGRKPNWVYVKSRTDSDLLFQQFLQAGYARVVVPCRPAYKDSVLAWLCSNGGDPWAGGELPGVDDPLYVSIADEFKETAVGDDGVVEDRFEVKMPTTLIMLEQLGAALPDNSTALNWP